MAGDGGRRAAIVVEGACEHNLRAVDLRLPRGVLTVVTGVSGSGKSSLVFDTIGREAQRRFLETMPSYARQFIGALRRPAVDRLDGLSPAVVLDQRPVTANPRSTVGTMTEVWDLLRLAFARLGAGPDGVAPSRALFSFNGVEGACPRCQGLGVADRLDPDLLVADPARSLRGRALRVSTPTGYLMYSQVTLDVLDQVLRAHGGSVDTPWQDLTDEQRRVVLHGSDRIRVPFGKHPLENRLKWTGITARPRQEGVYPGLIPVMEGILRGTRNPSILRFVRSTTCSECDGTRLRGEARAVRLGGASIDELGRLACGELAIRLAAIAVPRGGAAVWEPIHAALRERLGLLDELGLSYLSVDRPAPSLSAGEAQRVRLVSQAVGGLRGLLVVLDEPSIGLHPRDSGRLLGVLRRLRDAGNTVLVVEHDETAVRGADWLVDLGPGAGADGGEVVWSGPPGELDVAPDPRGAPAASATRTWLAVGPPRLDGPRRPSRGEVTFRGLHRNNLCHLEVTLRRGALNVVTGVSGAGKTSLLEELMARVQGGEAGFASVLEVTQAPIGRTPRSNPATYTGVFDRIRDLYAATPAARAAGFGRGHFSFNVAGGRCEACEGAGVVDVGMHFLGVVEVPCGRCGGRRFTPEVLAVRVRGRTIADVLAMRVDEALVHFAGEARITGVLQTLHDLGLAYLALGQSATTLSGGEAQRVRLAAELQRPAGGAAFVALDEPTTGLHAADVAVLLAVFERLVAAGATVVVAEHDRQVIAAADWVVDLGPDAGAAGGRVVATGPPQAIAACPESPTGAVLRGESPAVPDGGRRPVRDDEGIELRGVRTHNLKGIDIALPFPGLTVITGPSGSGKSSLAHDTVAAEGHARFADCIHAWARRFLPRRGAADLESARGLTPVVSIAQQPGRRNPRARVGGAIEVLGLLRLVYARAGVRPCPRCARRFAGLGCGCGFRLDPPPTASSFSADDEAGACPACRGLGFSSCVDPARLVTHPDRPLGGGALAGTRIGAFFGDPDGQHVATFRAAAAALGIDAARSWADLDAVGRAVAMRGAGEREFAVEWRFRRGRRSGVHEFRAAWAGFAVLVEREFARLHADERAREIEPLIIEQACAACGGTRLRPESATVEFGRRTLPTVAALPVCEVLAWLAGLAATPAEHDVDPVAHAVTADARAEMTERLHRLDAAGLGYLALDREVATLSAGEAQRVRLAGQLAGGLVGITQVLDEPTAGLHPRDTARLVALLRELAADNAVVVVEHDLDVITAADQVIELGPGAGVAGGEVVAQGRPDVLGTDPRSATGEWLRRRAEPGQRRPRRPGRAGVEVRGASRHNLRALDVSFPAGAITAVTGVSGSGKSTLVFSTLAPALQARVRGGTVDSGEGLVVFHGPVRAVVASDRHTAVAGEGSTVASWTGVWDPIRDAFARTPAARAQGLRTRDFSTAVAGGRCETCRGRGVVSVTMDLLPDVQVECEACGGKRFESRVLAAQVGGRTVADCLEMSVADAAGHFAADARVAVPLRAVVDVGLGYLPLGQATATLSGGELQRLRLAPVLAAAGAEGTFVLLDEPTTGLHHRDVDRLVGALHGLADRGCAVIVVEHNLEIVGAADRVVDLGPEGGPDGGRIVAVGTPEDVAATPGSFTGHALDAWFAGRPVSGGRGG